MAASENNAELDYNSNNRQEGSNATVIDLTLLLSRLSNRYASGNGKISDMSLEESEDLIMIFATME